MANRFISNLFKSGEEFEEFLAKLDAFKRGVEDGSIVIPNATNATKATQDADGNVIADTYAKKSDLESGAITVKKASGASNATTAVSATKATQDANGNVIADTYAKKSDLTSGAITVKSASSASTALTATNAGSATKAMQDANGKYIPDTYAKKSELTDGTITVKNATTAGSATKATQDANGNVIADTYAKKSDLTSGAITVKKASSASNATKLAPTVQEVSVDFKGTSQNIPLTLALNKTYMIRITIDTSFNDTTYGNSQSGIYSMSFMLSIPNANDVAIKYPYVIPQQHTVEINSTIAEEQFTSEPKYFYKFFVGYSNGSFDIKFMRRKEGSSWENYRASSNSLVNAKISCYEIF